MLLAEGKTKRIVTVEDTSAHVLLEAKDDITAHNATRKGHMEGKGVIATTTCALVFEYLNSIGVRTAFVEQKSDNTLLCVKCDMIPIEWVTRRVATGSFLKRNPGVPEGYRFLKPKLETFFKDDSKGDPQWSREQILCAKFQCGQVNIDDYKVKQMESTTVAVFQALERLWFSLGVALIDMKIEFGVACDTGELLVADVIDNDSWRIWPKGCKKLQMDKQLFRDVETVTDEFMMDLKANYQLVCDKLKTIVNAPKPHKVVILMGSPSDKPFCEKICERLESLDLTYVTRVVSAHKTTEQTLCVVNEYEAGHVPIVFIAVAGRSNGLGPVLAGNTSYPVINCPPTVSTDTSDIWSSLRVPSGLGCTTAIYPETAALAAASILAIDDHYVWSKLLLRRVNNMNRLLQADL